MRQTVCKIILFTLTACPTGRNMGTILREVVQTYPSIEFKTVYVELNVETTNHYKIKTNPTLLFLDEQEKELYRLEGFHETTEINQVIQEINKNKLHTMATIEPNKSTMEDYKIFLLKNGEPTAVEVQHHNKTSIKAPRITVINILLSANIEGYHNPFPQTSRLEKVEFDGSLANVTIKTETQTVHDNSKQMETLLLKTLESFGITEISMSF